MRNIGKIFLLPAILFLILGSGITAQNETKKTTAQDEPIDESTVVPKPTSEQTCVLLGLEREISVVQRNIKRYFEDLKDDNCRKTSSGRDVSSLEGLDPRVQDCRLYRTDLTTGWAVIPLTSELESEYGRREKFFLSEIGYIKWKMDANKKPTNEITGFVFQQKRTRVGAGYSVIKTMSADSAEIPLNEGEPGDLDLDECMSLMKEKEEKKSDPPQLKSVEKPLNMFVKEILNSGRGALYTFRFPKAEKIRDFTEELQIEGKKEKVQVIYVRNANQKINISREYLRLLKLMLRRIDWNTRAQNFRKQAEIQRILNLN